MAGAKSLVLISGVNGYIANSTAKAFLDAGWRVRGTARSKEASLRLLGDAFKGHIDAGDFEIVEVKDITISGAFDEAVKGVDAIAHLAAPISLSFVDPAPVMKGATVGTSVILQSAYKHAGPQLRVVVQMSSIAAIRSDENPPYTLTEANWNEVSEDVVANMGVESGAGHIYRASKTASEKVFWSFRDRVKPNWSMAAVNPSFVVGAPGALPDSPDELQSTTVNVWRALVGQEVPEAGPGLGNVVDVRDVARVIIFAAENPEKVNGERYLATSAWATPQTYYDILNKHYPERKGIIPVGEPGAGYVPGYQIPPDLVQVDNTKVPKLTGQDWIPFEQTVVDAAKTFERYL
ncbi:NAD(P)-binding protein [Rhizodiscina lignyota]|uniref:NAD(P)-binding protein n=1 Tax=Rhizodiscina lignyota TaxID=1504668 RepID=A0A9P4IFM9_9PEZI|nr:NAD(P)-binding protein [Rhizodiscina lignyota]